MPNRPIVNAGIPYCEGLQVNYLSNNSITIRSGYIRGWENITDLYLENDTILNPVDNEPGPNSIDIGIAAVDSVYNIFVIGDSTNKKPVATIMSLSDVRPLLPFGYDSFNRIATTYGSGGNIFGDFSTYGDGLSRTILYDEPKAAVMAGGGTATSFSNFDYSGVAPLYASAMHLQVEMTSASEANSFQVRHQGSSAANGNIGYAQTVSPTSGFYETVLTNFNNAGFGQYKITATLGDAITIYIRGFDYSVGI